MQATPQLPVAPHWFSVTWPTASIARLTEPHVNEWLRSNLWFVRGRERALLIDTGNGIALEFSHTAPFFNSVFRG